MLNIDGAPENSSDLERAPGARSIGEEVFETSILVIELQWCENTVDFTFTLHLLGSGLQAKSRKRNTWCECGNQEYPIVDARPIIEFISTRAGIFLQFFLWRIVLHRFKHIVLL